MNIHKFRGNTSEDRGTLKERECWNLVTFEEHRKYVETQRNDVHRSNGILTEPVAVTPKPRHLAKAIVMQRLDGNYVGQMLEPQCNR